MALDYGSARPLASLTGYRRSYRSPCLHPVVFREPRPTSLSFSLRALRSFAAIPAVPFCAFSRLFLIRSPTRFEYHFHSFFTSHHFESFIPLFDRETMGDQPLGIHLFFGEQFECSGPGGSYTGVGAGNHQLFVTDGVLVE
jgi:hypothetical protein